VIACLLADVRELQLVSRANDEDAALLPRVTHDRSLAFTFSESADPAEDNAGTKRAAQSPLEAGGRVGPQLWVDV
jgi:hypothetical protein